MLLCLYPVCIRFMFFLEIFRGGHCDHESGGWFCSSTIALILEMAADVVFSKGKQ